MGAVVRPLARRGLIMATLSLAVIGIDDGLFMGKSAGFGGTIKRRPSDFVVSGALQPHHNS